MDVYMDRTRHQLHLLLITCALTAPSANAAYSGATPGPGDLPETLKTPWYYTSSNWDCYSSQESIAQAYINARIGGRVCDSQYVGNDPDYPVDPLAGRTVTIPECAPRDTYNIPNQNAIPFIRQGAMFNFLTQIVSSGSSCPGGGWVPEIWGMNRESYEYCPRGYAIRIDNDSPGRFFCQLQNPIEDSSELCAGNPISIGTGNKHQVEIDFIDTRKGYLRLERHYNNYVRGGSPGLFGANWTSTFERRISYQGSLPEFVTVRRENGLDYQYIKQTDGSWQSNTDTRETLLETASGWTYISTDDETETYDVTGRLQSIKYLDGTILDLGYSSTGLLEEVRSSSGEVLTYYEDPGDADNLIDSVTADAGGGQPGRVWKYTYDSSLNLEFVISPDGTSATDNDNPVRQYYYENSVYEHALTGIKDERNIRYATFEYSDRQNVKGNVTKSFHGDSVNPVETVTVNYHDDNHAVDNLSQRTVTNSKGENTVYQTVHINGKALPISISGPGCSTCSNGGAITYSYYPASTNLFQKTDNNVTTEYGNYDTNGNPGYIIEARGTSEERRTDYTYDSRYFREIQTIIEPSVFPGASKVTTYAYDDFGNRTSEKITGFTPGGVPVNRTTSWQYNGPLHQLSLVDGPRTDISDITIYRYYLDDAVEGSNRARLREIENAAGILVRSNIQYTATGRIMSEDGANGLHISYRYYPGTDRLETMTRSGSSDIQVTRWGYLATGEVERITVAGGMPDAVTVIFGYDAARRLIRISDGLGNHIDYLLDSEGNRFGENVYDSAGILRKSLSRTFDAYNRPDTRSQENEQVDTDYAPDGLLHQQTDGKGSITTYSYDALKQLLGRTQDPGGLNARTKYNHDVAGQLTTVTDSVGGITSYSYEDLGNLLETASPDTGVTRYSYDETGNLTRKLDAKGQLFNYTYDSLNRLTLSDAPGTTDDIVYSYDGCTNGLGNLCNITFDTSIVNYSYDAFGNTIATQAMAYDYDAANRIRTVTYPSGSVVNYSYDMAGQINRVVLSSNGMDTVLAEQIHYQPFGSIESLRYGNGSTLNQQVDTAYRLVDQSIPGSLNLDYSQYDGNGNLLTRIDGASGSSDYSYDALGRLASAAGPFGNRVYGYDLNGNRLNLNDGTATLYDYLPQSNRLASENDWQYTLDGNGNTVSRLDAGGSGRLYTYNSRNRLVTAVNRSVTPVKGKNKPPRVVDTLLGTYFYNGLGQRVSKDVNGTVSQFVYDTDGKLMAEKDGAGVMTRDYVYLNNQLLAVLDYTVTENGGGEEVVMDNGFPQAGWTSKTSKKDYGADYLYSPGSSGNNIRWTPVLEAGDYEVYAWYVRNRKNSDSVPYTIMHNSQSNLVKVNQTTGGGSWQLLDSYTFSGAGNEYVEVSDSSGATSADAVKFVRVGGSADTVTTTVSYVHNDHLGTPQTMTDRTGGVVWRATYDPFGKADIDVSSSQLFNIRFPGQYFDTETGCHYNYFRYYCPDIGRYLTADPIGLQGGLNSYAYVGGNPLYWIDPLGLDPFLVGRPLQGGAGNYVGHMFAASDASYIGDPNAAVYSYGKSNASKRHGRSIVSGLTGRVDSNTTGFSATTNAADIQYWQSLGSSSCSVQSSSANPIPASDPDVDYWANRINPTIKYLLPIPIIGKVDAVNSNSAAQAVANRAASTNIARPQGPQFGYPGAKQWTRIEFR